MERKGLNRLLGFVGIFAGLVLVHAACAPAVTPGAVPREIDQGPRFDEEIGPLTGAEGFEAAAPTTGVTLSEDQLAIAEATTLEDVLGPRLESIRVPLTEEEALAITPAPVAGQFEEHMVTEFSTARVNIDEELLGVALAPREGWFEEHMTTEFPTGVVTLDEEFLSALGLSSGANEQPAISQGESAPLIEETAPALEEAAPFFDEFGEFGPAIEEGSLPQSLLPADLELYRALRSKVHEVAPESEDGTVLVTEEAVPSLTESAPVMQEAVPSIEEMTPALENAMPEKVMPQTPAWQPAPYGDNMMGGYSGGYSY